MESKTQMFMISVVSFVQYMLLVSKQQQRLNSIQSKLFIIENIFLPRQLPIIRYKQDYNYEVPVNTDTTYRNPIALYSREALL